MAIRVPPPITAFGPEVYREATLADEQAQLAADLIVLRQAKSTRLVAEFSTTTFYGHGAALRKSMTYASNPT